MFLPVLLVVLCSCLVTIVPSDAAKKPVLYNLRYETSVKNRLATTLVTGKIKNSGVYQVSAVLPAAAYVAGFELEIGSKTYKSLVTSQEEAKILTQNVKPGLQAANLTKYENVRDSNKFTIYIYLDAGIQEATFKLTYLQLLQRQNGSYAIITNLFPQESVENLQVQINIKETQNLKFVSALLRSDTNVSPAADKYVKLDRLDGKSSVVKFYADTERQKEIAKNLGTPGVFGCQLVVVYDVDRDCSGGDYMLRGSYFMHFFAPCDLESIPKEIVFVLDTSGSMDDMGKIDQLKTAMDAILPQLQKNDYVTIVQFSDASRVFTANGEIDITTSSVVADLASANNVNKIQTIVKNFIAGDFTDIKTALETGLKVARKFKTVQISKQRVEPMIIFLTDGQPNCKNCVEDRETILSVINTQNSGDSKIPIFCLSFGEDADEDFLKKLCSQNSGFFRHIYADKDVSKQLVGFYKEISQLTLTNLTFSYGDSKEMTKTTFPFFFDGYELVVSGKLNSTRKYLPKITAIGQSGPVEFTPKESDSLARLDSHWAHLSVKQILEARDNAEDHKAFDEAVLNIAREHNIVTPVSPLVVEGQSGGRVVEAVNVSKSGASLGYSIKEDDLVLHEFIADKFVDPVDAATRVLTSSLVLISLLLLTYL